MMGLIADRTRTRWGKFRPWILWTSVPFGVIALAAFSTPDLGPGAKVAYAWITYLLLLAVYAANNLPYAALSGVLTGNMKERNSMSAYRFVAVMIAQFIIQVLLLPLAFCFGLTASGWNGVLLAEVAHHVPTEHVAAATGAVLVIMTVGLMLAPPVFALLGAARDFGTAFMGLSALAMLGAACLPGGER